MGLHRIRTRDFALRCCHGAFCALGFASTVLFLMALLWIAWCYMGLSMVALSTGQRRALVNYSPNKPISSTPTTVEPSLDESSSNTISKLAPTSTSSSFHKARGESKSDDKPKGNATDMAKGDFADRTRATPMSKDMSTVPPPLISVSNNNTAKDVMKVEIKDDALQTRRIMTSSIDNRDEDAEPIQNPRGMEKDSPSKTLPVLVSKSDAVAMEGASKDEMKTYSKEYPREEKSSTDTRHEIQSSRKSDVSTASRLPDFERDPPMKERARYDDDEYTGMRSRTSTRDRVPYTYDEYSKGDSRLYPEDGIRRRSDSRRRDDRYEDDVPRRRGDDDDRYRYRDDDYISRSRDARYDDRDDAYRPRDDDSYRSRDEDRRYRLRSDEIGLREADKYPSRYDERSRPRTERRDSTRIDESVRPRIDDRDRPRIDDRDRPRLDERDRPRIDDMDRPRIDDRDVPLRTENRDKSRIDDRETRIIVDRSKTTTDVRDDDRYRTSDDTFNNRKIDEKSDVRYEDKGKVTSEERYRVQDDDRHKARGYRNRDGYRDEDEYDYRPRVDSRRRISDDTHRDEERYSRDRYRPRLDIDPYEDDTRTNRRDNKEPVSMRTDVLPPLPIRKSLSDRSDKEESDYPLRRSDEVPSRRRDMNDDNYRRPSRYDDRDRISPTRVRDDTFSTSLDSKSEMVRPALDGSRKRDHYSENTRIRDDKYYDEDERRSYYSSAGSSGYAPSNERREFKTRVPDERVESRYPERGSEVVLDRRSYASDEEDVYREKSNSRTTSEHRRDSALRGDYDPYESRTRTDDREEYPRRRKDNDEEYRRERPRSDYDSSRARDDYHSRDDDRYDDRPVRRYDDSPRRKDDLDLRKDERPYRNIDERQTDHERPSSTIDEARLEASRSSDRTRTPESPRISSDSDRRAVERPLNAKDVIEAALRHSDVGDTVRKVSYPVFDPRGSNLTSPDVIRPSERRGTTILSRKRRRLGV